MTPGTFDLLVSWETRLSPEISTRSCPSRPAPPPPSRPVPGFSPSANPSWPALPRLDAVLRTCWTVVPMLNSVSLVAPVWRSSPTRALISTVPSGCPRRPVSVTVTGSPAVMLFRFCWSRLKSTSARTFSRIAGQSLPNSCLAACSTWSSSASTGRWSCDAPRGDRSSTISWPPTRPSSSRCGGVRCSAPDATSERTGTATVRPRSTASVRPPDSVRTGTPSWRRSPKSSSSRIVDLNTSAGSAVFDRATIPPRSRLTSPWPRSWK